MANEQHVAFLKKGVRSWNDWSKDNPNITADFTGAALNGINLSQALLDRANLSGADLSNSNLVGANLYKADLTRANLNGANLQSANLFRACLFQARLRGANLCHADISETDLRDADLSKANLNDSSIIKANLNGANLNEADIIQARMRGATLFKANLCEARLTRANLTGANLAEANLQVANLIETQLKDADLRGANLSCANLVGADLTNANLTGCRVWGISAWRLTLKDTAQQNLVITAPGEFTVTVDDIEVAQFIYLLLNNQKIRNAIDTITSKVVLILGRFTQDRMVVLDCLRQELRKLNLLPILFDSDPSANLDISDTVTLLARMARFVVADLTDPRSVQQELTFIAPQVMVAIQPIIFAAQQPWTMFGDLQRRSRGLLPVHEYSDINDLVQNLQSRVIFPAEAKRRELLPHRPSDA